MEFDFLERLLETKKRIESSRSKFRPDEAEMASVQTTNIKVIWFEEFSNENSVQEM
jgi:hypothetical protein